MVQLNESYYNGLLADHAWMAASMSWTVVQGLNQAEVLEVLGRSAQGPVDPVEEVPGSRVIGGITLIPDEGWFHLLERSGTTGSGSVAALSSRGMACAVAWDTEGLSTLSMADGGDVVFHTDVIFLDDLLAGSVPEEVVEPWDALRRVVRREDESWHGGALAFVDEVTGRRIDPSWLHQSWPTLRV